MKTLLAGICIAASFTAAAQVDVRALAIYSKDKTHVILQDTRGNCPAGTLRFYHLNLEEKAQMSIWTGCWTRDETHVNGIDEDGDSFRLRINQFTWRDGVPTNRKPVTRGRA